MPGGAGSGLGLRDLLALLTALPLGGGSLAGAARAFPLVPLVGLLEGALATLALLLLSGPLGPLAAAGTVVALHIAVTGGLHLDGFSDYSEAVLARARGVAAERILSDPRRGSFALAAVAALLAWRLGLASGAADGHPAVLAAAYLGAAEALYAYIALAPAPRGGGGGMAAAVKAMLPKRHGLYNAAAYLASLATAASAAGLLGLAPPQAVAAAAVAPLAAAAWAAGDSARRIGRPSGDAAGFAYELGLNLGLLAGLLAG